MEFVEYILYIGYALLIIGTIGAVIGPRVDNPLIRMLNVEVPTVGVSLIFLAYDEALALMTFIAVNAVLSLILIRAVILDVEYKENE
ncbi:EhaE family protein [Methanocaldococcus fervens]|uniref:(NiFe)-hydrogenase-3-type complex Eha, membrane protein EhaE n=1 Tax=Methanocaldococcus fervens (strain DSM 4213 / JCM 15782 / AG86) TaxID=573064 RepID=C7P6H7_METFA|nr:EhaE family protein [Methanocaldococcus fervens]ACV24159.1 (NiFe)-hydrogenase-3-type complex Eha, membrane protein EhaE [Methanocaldococcus fervens AG86]